MIHSITLDICPAGSGNGDTGVAYNLKCNENNIVIYNLNQTPIFIHNIKESKLYKDIKSLKEFINLVIELLELKEEDNYWKEIAKNPHKDE